MAFQKATQISGLIYVPERRHGVLTKYGCNDCFACQMCSSERCKLCISERAPEKITTKMRKEGDPR
jgi:hypothetical protein